MLSSRLDEMVLGRVAQFQLGIQLCLYRVLEFFLANEGESKVKGLSNLFKSV